MSSRLPRTCTFRSSDSLVCTFSPSCLLLFAQEVDFIDGLSTICGAGDCRMRMGGLAVHIYTANRSMGDKCFNNSDGDMLIVPQLGAITIRTGVCVCVCVSGCCSVVARPVFFWLSLAICFVFGRPAFFSVACNNGPASHCLLVFLPLPIFSILP